VKSVSSDRRGFLKAGAAATVAGVTVPLLSTAVHAAGNDTIKVGLIGCGGRGTGAMKDSLEADKNIVVHALGDFFLEQASKFNKELTGSAYKERVQVGDRVFGGLDAYKKVLESGPDLVILATPPGFRPLHLEAAVKAGKHIFCEKPVAVDGPGIRKCMALVEESKKKNLAIVAGTQRRHQAGYIETIKQIQGGAIGDIVSMQCAWNDQGIWFKPRRKDESDLSYHLYNWYHFLWICGDHIVEQHVHNLDVCNWVMGTHPEKCVGFGGRSYRQPGDPKVVGHIWDHFSVEYTYPKGVPMYSTCTHIPGSMKQLSENVHGTKGNAAIHAYRIGGKKVYNGNEVGPYVQEHIDLVQSIKANKPLNELQQVTESTLTAIMGRMAAYSGKVVTWNDALNSEISTMPENLSMDSIIEVPPVPVPGKTKV
jgi:myo-inositol 2-dehydrogenase / D-chiro-inositol 1-dehydrogenase